MLPPLRAGAEGHLDAWGNEVQVQPPAAAASVCLRYTAAAGDTRGCGGKGDKTGKTHTRWAQAQARQRAWAAKSSSS